LSEVITLDFDGDGVRDSVDIDDDNDGIVDVVENNPIDSGTQGVADAFDADGGAYLHVLAHHSGSTLNYFDATANQFVQIGEPANFRYISAGFDADTGFVYATVMRDSSGTDSNGTPVVPQCWWRCS